MKAITSAGHRLCNHAVSHDTAMNKKDVAYQEKEIMDAKRMIDDASGYARIWYYRAPGGAFTPESREVAARNGMANLGWNVDPGDFNRPGADAIVSTVQDQLKSKGPTILLHDGGGDRSQSVEALQKLLPWLKEQGYDFSSRRSPRRAETSRPARPPRPLRLPGVADEGTDHLAGHVRRPADTRPDGHRADLAVGGAPSVIRARVEQ